MKPLVIDLFCGLGGWAEGFLAEDYRIIGFDNEPKPYPGEFVLQDVTTLDGARFKDAAVIVASPPCQAYSYRAMPWKRAKALPPPDNTLFDTCFRIQREASAAAGHHIPMVVENVCGAQKWVGPAKAHYGSYYLWGDVGSVGGCIVAGRPEFGMGVLRPKRVAKVSGAEARIRKSVDPTYGTRGWFGPNGGTNVAKTQDGYGVKQGGEWWNEPQGIQRFSSRAAARKHATAMIAKIPLALARHIAGVFK